uniref:Uncharacterized protein n=1 Tax=Rangifer tarandus platyrhynchus TaxID=3082113 RepID=A0ACB0E7N4_RANTA|nr:unnamed protein product [Rangifer tarandus platyrhynchus]
MKLNFISKSNTVWSSIMKRNLPSCTQVSPASSRPGNGGDYLLCISQRAAGSEALGLSSAPSRDHQIKSRESSCQTAAVEEGDAATALKQRLPRGAGHRGAGDPDGAAVSQCSSPTPKREAHAQPQRGGSTKPDQRGARGRPLAVVSPRRGPRSGAAPCLLHAASLTQGCHASLQ